MPFTIPKHIAIIMDGNGRWAQKRGHPRIFGHVRGSSRVKGVVRESSRLGVKALTLYAFSTENWNRPETERKVLWRLLKKYVLREAEELNRENVRLRVIGEIERLDTDVRKVLEQLIERLSVNTGLQLTLAISYGSRSEISRAASAFAVDCLEGRCKPQDMNEALMEKYLWTSQLGDLAPVDLFIRTSGEYRMSNFLLWQAAYAEFLFLDKHWPDFTEADLRFAIDEFSKRERRYGGIA